MNFAPFLLLIQVLNKFYYELRQLLRIVLVMQITVDSMKHNEIVPADLGGHYSPAAGHSLGNNHVQPVRGSLWEGIRKISHAE